jgi:hypothetical protein
MLSTASSLTPISRYPNRSSKNGFAWERLEQKKKSPPSRNRTSIGRLPKSPTPIIESKRREPDAALKGEPQTQRDRGTDLNNVARQDLIIPLEISSRQTDTTGSGILLF